MPRLVSVNLKTRGAVGAEAEYFDKQQSSGRFDFSVRWFHVRGRPFNFLNRFSATSCDDEPARRAERGKLLNSSLTSSPEPIKHHLQHKRYPVTSSDLKMQPEPPLSCSAQCPLARPFPLIHTSAKSKRLLSSICQIKLNSKNKTRFRCSTG